MLLWVTEPHLYLGVVTLSFTRTLSPTLMGRPPIAPPTETATRKYVHEHDDHSLVSSLTVFNCNAVNASFEAVQYFEGVSMAMWGLSDNSGVTDLLRVKKRIP